MKKIIILVTVLFYFNAPILAQENNLIQSPKQDNSYLFLPASLLILGGITSIPDIKTSLQQGMFRTDTNIDDFLQFAPIFIMYGSYLFNVKHANTFGKQSLFWGISQLLSNALVFSLKAITAVPRPHDSSLLTSFPSGHTANAFLNATILYEEFKDHNKILAFSGYPIALAVAILRVSNNRHWVPDVLVGASLGILMPKLVYRFRF